MAPPVRKRIRLPADVYRETGRLFSVTIGTSPRSPVFSDAPFAVECIEHLRKVRDSTETLVYAYCLMPDHVHLLLGVASKMDLSSVIGSWRSLCSRSRRRRGEGARFWQRSFYDHGLRRSEDVIEVARYILNNPVRARLVEDFHDYPLCGSMEFDL